MTTRPANNLKRRAIVCGFSLIEVLLAIFILGVGVISIAALFPAGIAQQRQSVDDVIGPTVANNVLSILRSKIKPEDFGTFEQFGVGAPRITIQGDFNWLRPGFVFADDPATPGQDERGSINIFSAGAWGATEFAGGYPGSTPSLVGIPYNTSLFGSAPRMLISQTERYYPAVTQVGTGDVGKPQYVWDCMFRRFQGKVLVAIFVYRVTQPGGGNTQYITQPGQGNPALPPLPIWLDLTLAATQATSCADGPWHPGGLDNNIVTEDDNIEVRGVPGGIAYNPDDQAQCWQEPRQWILDQNNNMHRVLSAHRDDPADDMEVELVRAAPGMPTLGVFYTNTTTGESVSDIWYIPLALPDINGDLLTLTPVYATVKEL